MAVKKNFYEAEVVSGGCTYRIEAQPLNKEIPHHGQIELAVRLMEYDSSYDEYAVCVYVSGWDTYSPDAKIEQRMPRHHHNPGQGLMRLHSHDASHLGNMFLIASHLASCDVDGAYGWVQFAKNAIANAKYSLEEEAVAV